MSRPQSTSTGLHFTFPEWDLRLDQHGELGQPAILAEIQQGRSKDWLQELEELSDEVPATDQAGEHELHGQHRQLRAKLEQAALQAAGRSAVAGAGGPVQPTAWLVAKGMQQAGVVGRLFLGLWQAHDRVRLALCTLWEEGQLADAATVRRLIIKLTRFKWSLTYEAMNCAFVQCADCVALELKALLPGNTELSTRQDYELWSRLLAAWGRYRKWMAQVVSMCGLLVECVSAERGAEMLARGRLDSPTLFDAAKGAFRSQVLVAYGLRRPLQAALLRGRRAHGQPQSVAGLMCDIRKCLQELDVADDNTQVEAQHTREKLRRCFGLEGSVMDLQLRGPLRVPPLQ
ncbi:hypothetical protein WJX72_000646 [[Myrmecia] bisecta]|uniref:Uncharacterized protein n=1 Tax=[Myrmecia] bisecta TaxID=41462 RepID=A0AAW1PS23_9CHLO